MASKHQRNTRSHRICRECDGSGEAIRNNSFINDPQCEYEVRCGECYGDGWIRTTPVDPITQLAQARRQFRKFGHLPHIGMGYGELLQRVVTPAALPDDTFAVSHAAAMERAA